MTQTSTDRTNAQESSYTFTEVAYHFQVTPDVLRGRELEVVALEIEA